MVFYRRAGGDWEPAEFGTTCTAVTVVTVPGTGDGAGGRKLVITANAGDSDACLIRPARAEDRAAAGGDGGAVPTLAFPVGGFPCLHARLRAGVVPKGGGKGRRPVSITSQPFRVSTKSCKPIHCKPRGDALQTSPSQQTVRLLRVTRLSDFSESPVFHCLVQSLVTRKEKTRLRHPCLVSTFRVCTGWSKACASGGRRRGA